MKLEIGNSLRRFWHALDRIEETPILDLKRNLVVPDGPFDYLTALSRRSRVVRELIEKFQLTSAEVYEWQTKFPAEIKLLWCLLDLISRIERTSIKVGIFWEMLDKKNNYGMLWKWTDADKQKLSKALELMEYILHQLGLSAGKIVVSHKDYRGLSVPDISPELKQLSIKLMNLEQIAPVEILVALQINPTLLNLTLPTGLEQLCNFLVNNTLDYFTLWLKFLIEPWLDLHEAWQASGGSPASGDDNPFMHMSPLARWEYGKAEQEHAEAMQPPQPLAPARVPTSDYLPGSRSVTPASMQPQVPNSKISGPYGSLTEFLLSKPSNGP